MMLLAMRCHKLKLTKKISLGPDETLCRFLTKRVCVHKAGNMHRHFFIKLLSHAMVLFHKSQSLSNNLHLHKPNAYS